MTFGAVFTLAWSTGCATRAVRDGHPEDGALVFGHIDIGEAKVRLLSVELDSDRKSRRTIRARLDKGLFYREAQPKAGYGISNFWILDRGMRGCWPSCGAGGEGIQVVLDSDALEMTRTHVSGRGVQFLGSYVITRAERSFTGRVSLGLARSDRPTEAEALEQLRRWTKGTRWDAAVQDRLTALGQATPKP